MDLFLFHLFKNKEQKIYKDISYFIFVNNLFHLIDKISDLKEKNIYLYLPSSYHLIEVVIASILSNKNIIYLSNYTLLNINNIKENIILITCKEYNEIFKSYIKNKNLKKIIIDLNKIIYKKYDKLVLKLNNYFNKLKYQNEYKMNHIFLLNNKKINISNLDLLNSSKNLKIDIKNTKKLFITFTDNLLNTLGGLTYLLYGLKHGYEFNFTLDNNKFINMYKILVTSNKVNISDNYDYIVYLSNKQFLEKEKINHIENSINLKKESNNKIFNINTLILPYHTVSKIDFYLYFNKLQSLYDISFKEINFKKYDNSIKLLINKKINIFYHNTYKNTYIYFLTSTNL